MLYCTAESMLKPQDGSQHVEDMWTYFYLWIFVNSTYDFEKYILNSNKYIIFKTLKRQYTLLGVMRKIGLKFLGSKIITTISDFGSNNYAITIRICQSKYISSFWIISIIYCSSEVYWIEFLLAVSGYYNIVHYLNFPYI